MCTGEDLPNADHESAQRIVPSTQTSGLVPAPFGKVCEALEKQRQQQSQHSAPVTEVLTVNQLRYIKKLIAETHTNEAKLLGFLGFANLETIPKSEVNRVIRTLESHKQEAA